jgi:pimeloyl-ACP methyl ester carboxylesterase
MPTVKVNGIAMYYEVYGKGEPLVLIAGLATNVTHYQHMIRELSQKYQVIAFDNQGAGRTDKPDISYSIEMMADDMAGLLASLGIESAYILGISMGGRIALTFTLDHPEHVKSLTLASTSAKGTPVTMRWRLINLLLRIPMLKTRGEKYPQANMM